MVLCSVLRMFPRHRPLSPPRDNNIILYSFEHNIEPMANIRLNKTKTVHLVCYLKKRILISRSAIKTLERHHPHCGFSKEKIYKEKTKKTPLFCHSATRTEEIVTLRLISIRLLIHLKICIATI